MSIFDRFRFFMERRAKEPRDPRQDRVPYNPRTLAGFYTTPDTAVTIPAVWACLRYLSQTVAVLPWHVLKDTEKGGELQPTHPLDYLLCKRVSAEWSSFQFRETMTHWALRWGNAYAEIEFNVQGRPIGLWPIHPERVEVMRDPETQRLFYRVDSKLEFPQEEIFHIRGFGEGPVGVNVIAYAAQSIGWAAAVQLFGASFFGNGMNVSGVIKLKNELSVPALAQLKKEMAALYKGVRNANKVAYLDKDMEFQPIQMEAQKAQLIEINQHLVEDICRWFGVPPHKIMHLLRATFSNIEHQAIEVVVDSITPWAKRFEDEADYKLFGANRPNFYTKMNMNALMRGDVAARGTWYQMMRNVGAFTVNDILRLEDQNTISEDEGGDKRVMQQGFTTLERIGEEPVETVAAPAPAPGVETEPDPEEDTDIDIDTNNRLGVIEISLGIEDAHVR